jgi:hypothetical protein
MFTGPNSEGHFRALYDVAEIIFTMVKIFFQAITEKCNIIFIGKYENKIK